MSRAVILGCSHAAGSEMERDPELTAGVDSQHYGIQNSYPVQIAHRLGYSPENYSIGGGSNDSVFRIFTELADGLTSADIVIACWTGPDRTEIWDDLESCWQQLAPGNSNFYRRVADPWVLSGRCIPVPVEQNQEFLAYQESWTRRNVDGRPGRLNKIKNILATNSLALSLGVRVLNIDSFAPIRDFAWPSTVKWASRVAFWDWAGHLNYPHTDWGHFYIGAHRAFADLVVAGLTTNSNAV